MNPDLGEGGFFQQGRALDAPSEMGEMPGYYYAAGAGDGSRGEYFPSGPSFSHPSAGMSLFYRFRFRFLPLFFSFLFFSFLFFQAMHSLFYFLIFLKKGRMTGMPPPARPLGSAAGRGAGGQYVSPSDQLLAMVRGGPRSNGHGSGGPDNLGGFPPL